MYVVTSKCDDITYKENFKYTRNGLLSKRLYSNGNYSEKFYYKKEKVIKVVKGGQGAGFTELWKYVGGRLSEKVITHKYTSDGKISRDITYEIFLYNKKGQIKKWIVSNNVSGTDENLTYSYNKRGQITKRKYRTIIYKYKYDKKGNIKSIKDSTNNLGTNKYKLTYKRGRVTKQVITNVLEAKNSKQTKMFKYKKIKVPQKYVNTIKKQQWEIINGSQF